MFFVDQISSNIFLTYTLQGTFRISGDSQIYFSRTGKSYTGAECLEEMEQVHDEITLFYIKVKSLDIHKNEVLYQLTIFTDHINVHYWIFIIQRYILRIFQDNFRRKFTNSSFKEENFCFPPFKVIRVQYSHYIRYNTCG